MLNIRRKNYIYPKNQWLNIAAIIYMGMSPILLAVPEPALVATYQKAIGNNVLYAKVPDLRHAEAVAAVIEANKNLESIGLTAAKELGAEGVKFIADALANNKNIKELDLDNWKMGVEGAKYLASALNNSGLEKLKLKNENIGAEGTKFLADALAKNSRLSELYLKDVDIGGAIGAQYLTNALKENISLLKLDILKGNLNLWASEADDTYIIHLLEKDKNFEIMLSLKTYPDLMEQMLAKFSLPDSGTLFSRLPKELIKQVLDELVRLKKQKIKAP